MQRTSHWKAWSMGQGDDKGQIAMRWVGPLDPLDCFLCSHSLICLPLVSFVFTPWFACRLTQVTCWTRLSSPLAATLAWLPRALDSQGVENRGKQTVQTRGLGINRRSKTINTWKHWWYVLLCTCSIFHLQTSWENLKAAEEAKASSTLEQKSWQLTWLLSKRLFLAVKLWNIKPFDHLSPASDACRARSHGRPRCFAVSTGCWVYHPGLEWSQGRGHEIFVLAILELCALDFPTIQLQSTEIVRASRGRVFAEWKTVLIEIDWVWKWSDWLFAKISLVLLRCLDWDWSDWLSLSSRACQQM